MDSTSPPWPGYYCGGESSRIYCGDYIVREWFTWPDGQLGEHETAPAPYEDCVIRGSLASGGTLLEVVDPDTGQSYDVRIERARIEEAA